MNILSRVIPALFALALFAGAEAHAGEVIVNTGKKVGTIKPMHAVNNGPVIAKAKQKIGNFDAYKAARFPFARTHDASFYWQHTVDITEIFPDFNADETDPASYDFKLTDLYLANILKSGTKVFYRLGQRIESAEVKYGVHPPKDYQKWARICEHIIRHFNEGWADGHHMDIRYWEIWNEADLGSADGRWKKGMSPNWNGSEEDYFRLYDISYRHLKKCFPDLQFGGPALCGDEAWCERFLRYVSRHKVGLDFFSWHLYTLNPEEILAKGQRLRTLLDRYGYASTPSFLDEWNFVTGWTDDFPYSLEVVGNIKGAAFVSAAMQVAQDGPIDMLMYYDARPRTAFNGLFDFRTMTPLPSYYALYGWNRLYDLQDQVETVVQDMPGVYATAASKDGKTVLLLSRYSGDNNVIAPCLAKISIPGAKDGTVIAHATDRFHLFTEIPLEVKDGQVDLWLEPDSFWYLSFE
ncbi:MAG: hypothetical protein IJ623_03255 [Bacteroidales bacterium]|nr:hypothetical protein [Bacteroidales bacterium]